LKNILKKDTPSNDGLKIEVKTRWVEVDRVRLKGTNGGRKNAYGNYLLTFTPEAIYIVYGINPQTNRKNKKQVKAIGEADAIKKAEAAGLIAPFEITCLETFDAPAPTERQLEYAKDMDIRIPIGACKWDVSALLARGEENDPDPAPDEYLDYLAARKWGGSSLIGCNAAFKELFSAGELGDRLAMYAYYIYQTEHKLPVLNLDTDSRKDCYFAFGDYAIQNPKIITHFDSWYDDGSCSTQKNWGIYKDYKEYFNPTK
jgi:hypothetical protein